MSAADLSLARMADRVLVRQRNGGSICPPVQTPAGAPDSIQKPWWLDFPLDAQYFDFPGVIATPALGTAATVLSFTVPSGWDGVIRKVSHNYTGPGFVQGSGDLVWTIRVGGAAVKNYNLITSEFGSPQQPRDTYIILRENQLVEYVVTVSATAVVPVAGTFIVVFMAGWEVPRSKR